ncbi:MAG: tRNA (N6-isopentenyl adenosine(37)-C2)-methylthiotransferase MiaB, partial [Desulfotomaculales bacterium]
MNEHDSEVMAGILEEMGYRQAESREEADVILVNTCCVRETAENKVYGLLGELRKLKMDRPDLLIGV